MQGGVLDACERLIDRERLSHVLSELRAHIVRGQTANKVEIETSAAADSTVIGKRCLLDRGEGGVRF